MSANGDRAKPPTEWQGTQFTAVNVHGKEKPQGTTSGVNVGADSLRPQNEGYDPHSQSTSLTDEKPSNSSSGTNQEWSAAKSGDRQYPNSTDQVESKASSKRRRSTSKEPVPVATITNAGTEREEDSRSQPHPHPHPETRESYAQDSHYSLSAVSEDNRSSASNVPWNSRQYSQANTHSDEHIGEVLQRASQAMEPQRTYEELSPGSDQQSGSYSAYSHDQREVSIQSDPKKRKRNFSNRTKTGCMTCRRRKKKCDETRPECNNCLRGGFVCSGYQQRGQWPKNEHKQPPVPLQSKTDYEAPVYAQPPYPQHTMAPRREPLPGYRGQTLRVDPQHSRPHTMEEEQPSATPSESHRLSALSYPQQTLTPVSAVNSAYPDRQIKAFERIGPPHDLSRQDTSRQESEAGTPLSSTTTGPPQLFHNSHVHPESPHANPQVAAQMALSNLASSNRQRSQKEDMLAGHHYYPFDKELVLERERCNAACWRFNSSTNPNNGVSPEERARLFRDILQPRELLISPTQGSHIAPVGQVGENVVVEAPFTCDYGYNISIGQDVAIGKNCTILDTCEVTIGDRCSIGPNVNIYTATLPVDPKRRLGSRGPNLGRKITIDSDCWIGGGVTILPGRTIGKGSTVGAGSIVTRDVPPYTVVCGNPARVIRGLYPPHEN